LVGRHRPGELVVTLLMMGVSGVRGVVGDTLTPDLVSRFAAAFGTYCRGGSVVIGRDARRSGPMMREAVAAGLTASGCRVIDLGIVTTPTIQLSVKGHKAKGGVAITASHNPIDWNAMKFIGPSGVFLNTKQGRRLIHIYRSKGIRYVSWDKLGEVVTHPNAAEEHVEHILRAIDVEAVSRKAPVVAVDCCNGAPSEVMQVLLKRLGCKAIPVNCEMTGTFPRGPEPTASSLRDLCRRMIEGGADIGFATDPDGDRISIVTEKGVPLGEEYSLVLATEFVLEHKLGPVVTNVATTRAVEDIATRRGCPLVRSAVGEANVVEKMIQVGAVIGGEGNGGVINPAIQYARDGPAATALILEGLCHFGGKLSILAKRLPKYYMIKKKIPCDPSRSKVLLEEVKNYFDGERIDLTDGIRVIRDSSWIYVRKSGTEPIVRVICEAKTKKEAVSLSRETTKLIQGSLCRG